MNGTIAVCRHVSPGERPWVDCHNYGRYLKTFLSKIENDSGLSQHNKQALLDYTRSMGAKKPPTILKNLQVCDAFLRYIKKDMGDSIAKEDCDKYYLDLINNDKIKPWTIKK